MLRRNKVTLLLILTLLLLLECGIADIPTFGSATISVIQPGVIRVNHNTSNTNDSFVGYEVYYKLYHRSDITIAKDRDILTDTVANPKPSNITSRNFRKLIPVTFDGANFVSLETSRVPLLKPTQKSSGKFYTFDFSNGSTVDKSNFIYGRDEYRGFQALIIEDNGAISIIQRQLNNSNYKSFFNTATTINYKKTDDDINNMIGSTFDENDSMLLIVLAVIPYGIDFQAAQKVYGDIVVSNETSFTYTQTP